MWAAIIRQQGGGGQWVSLEASRYFSCRSSFPQTQLLTKPLASYWPGGVTSSPSSLKWGGHQGGAGWEGWGSILFFPPCCPATRICQAWESGDVHVSDCDLGQGPVSMTHLLHLYGETIGLDVLEDSFQRW